MCRDCQRNVTAVARVVWTRVSYGEPSATLIVWQMRYVRDPSRGGRFMPQEHTAIQGAQIPKRDDSWA